MPLNPETEEIVRNLQKCVTERPPGPVEAELLAQIIALAPEYLPLAKPILGEALIQVAALIRTLMATIHERDALLDWESTVTIAINIAFAAGLELYTGGEVK